MAKIDNWIRDAFALHQKGERAQAEAICRKILKKMPKHAGALYLVGLYQLERGEPQQALKSLQQADRGIPNTVDVQVALATALGKLNRYDEALALFEKVLAVAPNSTNALHQLALLHFQMRNYSKAIRQYEKWIRINPRSEIAIGGVGNCLMELSDFAGARECYQKSLSIKPLPWVEHNLLFAAAYDPEVTPEESYRMHAAWGNQVAQAVRSHALTRHPNPPDPARRLRIGYLSPDLKRHPVSMFLSSIMAYHDPSQVEVYCYGNIRHPDAVTAAVRQQASVYRDTLDLSDQAVAAQIADDRIDILVELAGLTAHNQLRVLAFKPAPVQVSFLGYPSTTGLPTVDYRLTDALTNPPETEKFYTERLERVEGGFSCFIIPPDLPDPGPLPARENGYITFGSLVTLRKVNRQVVALWAEVMRAVPDSRILLFRDTLGDEEMRNQFRGWFDAEDIDASRVAFGWEMPPPEEGRHYAIYRKVDIVLDTLPFSGHTSSCEALAMGVPVLTCKGPDFAGRLSYAVLEMVGLEDFVADSSQEFVALAKGWAGRLDELADIRAGLRQRMERSRLNDAEATTRAIEAAYRRMWKAWCATQG
ncbi:MAG: tetratricopeptide repeat protein [Leptospirillia bacterium]